ncbi:MAG TPA: hypothetical protein VHC18_24120 [Amycolatopsis sp.]|nr:hypothetical protein [Amycolatopsis sp.]
MAEDNETPSTDDTPTPKQVAAARRFVAEHGTPSKAVVENIGRKGARVVLVGKDGALGDVIVRTPAAGDALVESVADLEPAEWDAATVGATQIGPEHRRRMAGPRAARR